MVAPWIGQCELAHAPRSVGDRSHQNAGRRHAVIPAVDILDDHMAASDVASQVDVYDIAVEHALAVEVHEREIARLILRVAVDADPEPGSLSRSGRGAFSGRASDDRRAPPRPHTE